MELGGGENYSRDSSSTDRERESVLEISVGDQRRIKKNSSQPVLGKRF